MGKRVLLAVAAVVVFGLAVAAGQAADRTDRSFAGGGLVETPVPKALDPGPVAPNIWDLARHGRGFVGALADLTGKRNTFAVVRYRRDGSLDRSFGEEGFTRPLPLRRRRMKQAHGIAVQGDGRIVVAGFSAGSRQIPLVVRYRSDGSLDPSFGRGGIVNLPRIPRALGVVHDVAIQPGGRIVVVGTISESGIGTNGILSGGFVAAYLPNGGVDRSFGAAGRVYFDLPRPEGGYSGLKAVAAMADGRLLISGFQGDDLFMARLLADGRLDPGFGHIGRVVISVGEPGCYDVCWQAAPFEVRPDGRVLVVASVFPYPPKLLRLLPDGRFDQGFGRRGRVELPVRQLGFSAFDLGLQRGRILIAGWDERRRGDSELSYSVFRYREDGGLDRGFGSRGRVVRPLGQFSGAFAVLPQSRGRAVVAGGVFRRGDRGPARSTLLLTRYLPGD